MSRHTLHTAFAVAWLAYAIFTIVRGSDRIYYATGIVNSAVWMATA